VTASLPPGLWKKRPVVDYLAKNFSKHPKARSQWPLAENPAAGTTPGARPEVVRGVSGAQPQRRVADRATRRAERRCAAFSATS